MPCDKSLGINVINLEIRSSSIIRMKTFKFCVIVASIAYFIIIQNSCSDVEPIKDLDITTSMCSKIFNTTVCPDSNLFHILIKGHVRGDVGTILIVHNSFPDSVVMNCGDWSHYPSTNADFTIYERKSGQSEEVDFEYRGYNTNQCLGPNTYFTDQFSYSIYRSNFNEYGNPNVILWDPDNKYRHFVSCR